MVLALAAIQARDVRAARAGSSRRPPSAASSWPARSTSSPTSSTRGSTLTTNLFGSTFFVLTGFHGAHVTGGVLWLLTLWSC